jgi:hypothetical protein
MGILAKLLKKQQGMDKIIKRESSHVLARKAPEPR